MTYRPGYGPVSDAQALEVGCPKCNADRGKPCVYLPRAQGPYTPPDARAGTPTQRAHNERRNYRETLRLARERRARHAELDDAHREAVERMATLRPAANAIRAFDRAEADALRAWLARYGDVLTSLPPPATEPSDCCAAAVQHLRALDWRTSTAEEYRAVLVDHAAAHGVMLDAGEWYDGPHSFLGDSFPGNECCLWCGEHRDGCRGQRAVDKR